MCWKLGSPVGWWGPFKRLGLMGDGRSSGHTLGRDWCCFPGIHWILNMRCRKRGLGGASSSLGSVASCFPVWSLLATCAPVIVIHVCEALTRALAICCFAFESLTPLAWGQRDGSAGEGVCCQAWWLELDPWDPYGGGRKPVFTNCPLIPQSSSSTWTAVYLHVHVHTCVCACTHTYNV